MRLSIAIDAYLAYRRNGWSESTVRGDRKVLTKLQRHFGDVNLNRLTPAEVDEFLQSTNMNNVSPNTYNLWLSGLRNFFKYLRQRKHIPIDSDPLVGQRKKPSQDKPQLRLSIDEFPALLNAAQKPRDRMAIAVGLYLMLRESEARSIRLGDINMVEGEILIYVHKSKIYDKKPITPELREELNRYLRYYAEIHGNLQDDWFLLPQLGYMDSRGEYEMVPSQGLGPGGLSRVVQGCIRALGHPTQGTGMHTLRRSAAAALFLEKTSKGYDGALRQVAAWLNHKQQRTSEIYLGIDVDKNTRNEEAKAGPLYPSLADKNIISIGDYNGDRADQAM